MSDAALTWLITAALLLLVLWRAYVLKWFEKTSVANEAYDLQSHRGYLPGFSLIILSAAVGGWNVTTAINSDLIFSENTSSERFHGAGQYLLIILAYLIFPFLRGLYALGSIRAQTWLVAGAFVSGHVFAPLFIAWGPKQ